MATAVAGVSLIEARYARALARRQSEWAMGGEVAAREHPDVPVHWEPRPPVEDPTLGVPVDVDRSGRPANGLVTIGDSLAQGFMRAAIFRTDLSWPARVAFASTAKPRPAVRSSVS